MRRRSYRSTAGQLPERYRSDLSSTPPEILSDQELVVPSSAMSPSHPDLSAQEQPQSGRRPRGRPPARNRRKAEVANSDTEKYGDPVVYPTAAFPTKDFPSIEPTSPKAKRVEGTGRDSMDAKVPPKEQPKDKTSKGANLGYRLLFLDGTWMDEHGRNVHFLNKYYDEHAEEYETDKKDNQGDMRDKNAAFRSFLETPEYEEASQYRSKEAVMEAFDRWWVQGGSNFVMARDDGQEKQQTKIKDFKDFKDEKFAALHFKLQWHMILEAEEDLMFHPPQHVPVDATAKSYRYARNVFGINNSLAIRALEKRNEEAQNKPELMPQKKDFAKAKEYLKGKGLALSLIEMYDYLDT